MFCELLPFYLVCRHSDIGTRYRFLLLDGIKAMTVSPVPFEPSRFWVSSESRADVEHLVDLSWQDEKWHRPKALCSCEQCQAKGFKVCKHILIVAQWVNEHFNEKEKPLG